MKLLDRFKTKQAHSAVEAKGYFGDKTNARNVFFEQLYAGMRGFLGLVEWDISADREALHKLYADKDKANHAIYAVVSDLATTAAAVMKYAEITNKDKKVIDDHWASKLLNDPNDAQTTTEFIELFMVNLLTVGDAFVYGLDSALNKDGRKFSSLYVMPSYKVEIISGGALAPIKGYWVKGAQIFDSKTLKLTPQNVLFCKLPNPSGDTFHGLSPLVPLLKDAEIMENGKKRTNGAIKNGGVGNIIFPQQDRSGAGVAAPQELDAFRKRLNGRRLGNYNEVVETPIGVARLGDTPADLALLQTSEASTQAICNAYHYPVDLLFGRSTFSNMAESKKMRYELAIPYANKFLEKFAKWLGVSAEGLTWQINVDQIEELKPDPNMVINAMNNAGTTINERREYLGYQRLEEEIYDKVTYPMNLSFGDEGAELSKPLPEITNDKKPKQ